MPDNLVALLMLAAFVLVPQAIGAIVTIRWTGKRTRLSIVAAASCSCMGVLQPGMIALNVYAARAERFHMGAPLVIGEVLVIAGALFHLLLGLAAQSIIAYDLLPQSKD